MQKIIRLGVFFLLFFLPSYAANALIETEAKYAVVIDYDTGAVLLDKRAKEPMPPSSMSKLMTAYMIFERLKDGRLSLDDTFKVSANAQAKGGFASGSSTMALEEGQKVKIRDILRGHYCSIWK